MGYATRKVKMRRHNNNRRRYAACVLLGVDFQAWILPSPKKRRMVNGFECVLPREYYVRNWPYSATLGSAVGKVCRIMGVE